MALCKGEEEVLVSERVNHPGTKHPQLSGDALWSRRYAEKSRLHDAQKLSHKERKDNGCVGKFILSILRR